MEIGTKVRLKDVAGAVMTVQRITPHGYVDCAWRDATGRLREQIFFPELLEEVTVTGTVRGRVLRRTGRP
jgi:uncharacterized protein YodC (DUF2158 family)